MPSKVPEKADKLSDSTSHPDLPTSGVIPAQAGQSTTLQAQFLSGQDVQSLLSSQINLFQQVLTSFSEAQARTTQQVLTNFSAIAAKTTALETQILSNINDTSNKLHSFENKLTTLSQDASNLVPVTKLTAIEKEVTDLKLIAATDSKVSSLEQDLADLRLALPARKTPNAPRITDVSKIKVPVKAQFELASKTVKLKDLVNALSNITFPSDEIKDVKNTYSQIRQAIDIGCSTNYLLPDIEHDSSVPEFFTVLVPPVTNNFYITILAAYKMISNSLLNFFIRKDTMQSRV